MTYKQNRLAVLERIRDQYRDILADMRVDLPDPSEKGPEIVSRDTAPSPDAPNQNVQTAGETQDLMDRIQAYNMADCFDLLPSGQYPQALVTTLPILFSSGSAVVSKEYQGFFKKISSLVKDRPVSKEKSIERYVRITLIPQAS